MTSVYVETVIVYSNEYKDYIEYLNKVSDLMSTDWMFAGSGTLKTTEAVISYVVLYREVIR